MVRRGDVRGKHISADLIQRGALLWRFFAKPVDRLEWQRWKPRRHYSFDLLVAKGTDPCAESHEEFLVCASCQHERIPRLRGRKGRAPSQLSNQLHHRRISITFRHRSPLQPSLYDSKTLLTTGDVLSSPSRHPPYIECPAARRKSVNPPKSGTA